MNAVLSVERSKVDLSYLLGRYRRGSSLRPDLLFTQFLPAGYRQTTLSSVDPALFDSVVMAKIHLGMIITLLDDLADHPAHKNPALLATLYRLNLGECNPCPRLSAGEKNIYDLTRFLFASLAEVLRRFPNFSQFERILRFDIEQFYMCNRYSELVTENPHLRNLTEAKAIGPFNMGIVAAGTIDLMASRECEEPDLGASRELFHLGQRLGRISNLIYTFEREASEGDTTNEIAILGPGQIRSYREGLVREFEQKVAQIRTFRLRSFDANRYAEGFLRLQELHASLAGRI